MSCAKRIAVALIATRAAFAVKRRRMQGQRKVLGKRRRMQVSVPAIVQQVTTDDENEFDVFTGTRVHGNDAKATVYDEHLMAKMKKKIRALENELIGEQLLKKQLVYQKSLVESLEAQVAESKRDQVEIKQQEAVRKLLHSQHHHHSDCRDCKKQQFDQCQCDLRACKDDLKKYQGMLRTKEKALTTNESNLKASGDLLTASKRSEELLTASKRKAQIDAIREKTKLEDALRTCTSDLEKSKNPTCQTIADSHQKSGCGCVAEINAVCPPPNPTCQTIANLLKQPLGCDCDDEINAACPPDDVPTATCPTRESLAEGWYDCCDNLCAAEDEFMLESDCE